MSRSSARCCGACCNTPDARPLIKVSVMVCKALAVEAVKIGRARVGAQAGTRACSRPFLPDALHVKLTCTPVSG